MNSSIFHRPPTFVVSVRMAWRASRLARDSQTSLRLLRVVIEANSNHIEIESKRRGCHGNVSLLSDSHQCACPGLGPRKHQTTQGLVQNAKLSSDCNFRCNFAPDELDRK